MKTSVSQNSVAISRWSYFRGGRKVGFHCSCDHLSDYQSTVLEAITVDQTTDAYY